VVEPENDKTSTLRIMHCLRAPVGGLFRHVCDLVNGQLEQGHSVGIICDIQTGYDVAGRVLKDFESVCDLGIHRLAISRRVSPRDVLTYRQIIGICTQQSAHILHGHGAKGGAFARLAASSIGAAAVYTPHGGSLHYNPKSLEGRFYISIERILRSRTDGLIFESDYARRMYVDKVGGLQPRAKLIVNGLHDDEFSELDDASAEYDFLFVGELRQLKGPQIMLEALKRLDRPCRALIVGNGPARAELGRKIQSYGLDSCVTLGPPMYPAIDAFERGACVVVPSLAESLPYVVLEAAAVGRPLIATSVGGIPEIFGPQASQLVSAGDAAALAEAMAEFLDQREAAKERARQLRQYVRDRFQVRQMVASTSDFYRSVAKN